jgi:hypothetical protein
MGRPLSKKFIGNRNIGSTGTGDDNGIGGEGLAAYTLAVQKGSLIVNSTYAQPALVIPAPNLPTGVQATAVVVWEVESVAVAAPALNGHGYATTTGGATTLTGLTGPTFNITAVGSGQGEVQTIVPVNRGSFTTIPRVATTYQVVGGDGGNQVTVKFRVQSITTAEKGSGYTSAPTLSWTTAGTNTGGTAVGVPTVALTTDSGSVGSSTNQENSIQITAWVPATGTAGNISGNGTSAVAGDIIRQCGNGKYIVRTAQGVGRVKLVAGTPDVGEATIIATDSAGGTYYVTKISDRRCNIVKGNQSGTQFTTGTSGINVSWTFNGTSGTKVFAEQPYLTANENVKIANA